ncbi:type I-E CRISPR-associated protein Cas6/Cse3/CasE [Dactylosporangium sp. NPDC000244]|uniref:type I-E CRISPR-associated protein Cas6/Cse3/CasE n=1 Tax=Dactylosporangium sp. NPDC000244 TaxID=3154365 RepID=UPI00332E67C3
MPYLSRIWLNPQRTKAQLILRNPQVAHAAVLAGISRQPVSERVLWRLEPDPVTQHRLSLLVLTDSHPSWEHLVEQAGWPHADEPQAITRPYEPLLNQIAHGRQFTFRLKANPTSSTKTPDSPSPTQKERLTQHRPRGVRVPHRTVAHQLAWFTSRIDRWGFTLVDGEAGLPAVRVSGRERLSFNKSSDRAAPVVLQTATFEGALTVTDPDTARQSLLHGVGHGKAYGLGLITLAPTISAAHT